MKKSVIMLIVGLSIAMPALAENQPFSPSIVLTTNAAYLGLSAISINGSNTLLILPMEAQVAVHRSFSINPSLTFLYFNNTNYSNNGFLILTECGIGYHPEGEKLNGWSLGLSPGIAYAFDAKLAGFVVSVEAGYQKIFGRGFVLGISGGGKYIWMDGDMVIPDLKLRIGYAF